MNEKIKEAVLRCKPEWVNFCQRLIQTPSPTYEEKAVAKVIMDEMKKLAFDEVWQDEKGNVFGFVKGTDPDAPVINLNSHMDHVAEGDPDDWAYPPFSGHIEGCRIYGRGASDTKGAIAVQAYAPKILMDTGVRPRSNIYATFVTAEEHWGQGTYYLLENSGLNFDLCILGEGTTNQIKIGHRGCIGIFVTVSGRSAHASMPEEGHNPNLEAARFLLRLEEVQKGLKPHPELGRTTMTPTLYNTGNTSRNVIPEKVTIYVDCRQSLESHEDLVGIIENVANDLRITAEVNVLEFMEGVEKISAGFSTPRNHPYVVRARNIVKETLKREVEVLNWKFCTDGRLTAAKGITTFGFSPCEEEIAHTIADSVSISLMEESLLCYPRFFMEMEKQD